MDFLGELYWLSKSAGSGRGDEAEGAAPPLYNDIVNM